MIAGRAGVMLLEDTDVLAFFGHRPGDWIAIRLPDMRRGIELIPVFQLLDPPPLKAP